MPVLSTAREVGPDGVGWTGRGRPPGGTVRWLGARADFESDARAPRSVAGTLLAWTVLKRSRPSARTVWKGEAAESSARGPWQEDRHALFWTLCARDRDRRDAIRLRARL